MTRSIPAVLSATFLLAGTASALAEPATTINGAAALAVAGVIAPHSPLLPAVYKKAVQNMFDGNVESPFKDGITITADKVVCRISNVDIGARSCELTFGKSAEKLSGRAANEIYATLVMAGVAADGAAGSAIEGLAKVNCVLDPAALADRAGGGATCSYEPAN